MSWSIDIIFPQANIYTTSRYFLSVNQVLIFLLLLKCTVMIKRFEWVDKLFFFDK